MTKKQYKIYELIPGVNGGYIFTDVRCHNVKTLSLLCYWLKDKEIKRFFVQDHQDPSKFNPLTDWKDPNFRDRRLDFLCEALNSDEGIYKP